MIRLVLCAGNGIQNLEHLQKKTRFELLEVPLERRTESDFLRAATFSAIFSAGVFVQRFSAAVPPLFVTLLLLLVAVAAAVLPRRCELMASASL